MPAALQGAIIVKQDGTRVTYKQKCEKCGNISGNTTTTSVSSSSSSKMTSSFRCSKCGNQQKVEIQGGK
jgi:DNA-directed RNA polymerase subunit M/transcription elongation factor TFIIS